MNEYTIGQRVRATRDLYYGENDNPNDGTAVKKGTLGTYTKRGAAKGIAERWPHIVEFDEVNNPTYDQFFACAEDEIEPVEEESV